MRSMRKAWVKRKMCSREMSAIHEGGALIFTWPPRAWLYLRLLGMRVNPTLQIRSTVRTFRLPGQLGCLVMLLSGGTAKQAAEPSTNYESLGLSHLELMVNVLNHLLLRDRTVSPQEGPLLPKLSVPGRHMCSVPWSTFADLSCLETMSLNVTLEKEITQKENGSKAVMQTLFLDMYWRWRVMTVLLQKHLLSTYHEPAVLHGVLSSTTPFHLCLITYRTTSCRRGGNKTLSQLTCPQR